MKKTQNFPMGKQLINPSQSFRDDTWDVLRHFLVFLCFTQRGDKRQRGSVHLIGFQRIAIMLEIDYTFTRDCHPQSNGKIERFHRTFKTEHTRMSAYVNSAYARIRMAFWRAYYNSERLHSAI
jgi:transposase InsO family protein